MSDPRLEAIRARLAKGAVHFSEADDLAYLLALIDTLQHERDEARRWLNDAGRAYSPCHEHQPDMWEGDGTCVICEGQRLKDRAEAAEARVSRLIEALRAARPTVAAAVGASHLTDGFTIGDDGLPCGNRQSTREDNLLQMIDRALASPDQEPQP